MYAPLVCKSNFSFLEGASHPGELVETCAEHGIDSMALVDRDGVYGVVQAHRRAEELDVDLIVGSQVTVDDGTSIVLLAASREGYANLCRLLTTGQRRTEKGESAVTWEEVAGAAGGLVALWGGADSRLAADRDIDGVADMLKQAYGDRLYAAITRHRRPGDVEREARVRERARQWELPMVAAHEVLYHEPARQRLQDVTTCIRHGTTLHEAGTKLRPNAEHALKSPEAFGELFDDAPRAVRRSLEVAERCEFSLDELGYQYPDPGREADVSSARRLRQLTLAGARERYGGEIPDDVREQLDREFELIAELGYSGYFLTMRDIVEYCEANDILCQGRGSAANSAVCYCLGITAIDPVRMDLLFERFVSRERNEPPDIDLDIEHDRREEVLQWVYEDYGRDRAAMVANVIRYRPKSAIRDVGKALGISETALDRVANLISHREVPGDELLRRAGMEPEARAHQLLLYLADSLLEFPRHQSIHPGGFVLGSEPVWRLVPIENGAMENRTVIQWDKYDLEEMEIFKVDLLGLGALSQLHEGFELIDEHYGERLSMDAIPAEDEETFDMICEGDTVGVFQIESRAQMAMLPRLEPRNYYDLVVEVSIVRPGPITGEMVHPYLRRRCGEEGVDYPHPSLEPVLEKTLGIPLFQEQVMKLAVVAADYSPGEADQLRRDMGSWRGDGQLDRHRERMIERMLANGIEREYAERIFEQIRGFGSYGFPESHAASFALIAYATAYLKCHYPAVFTCALLNAQPMGFYPPSTVVENAKHDGVEVRSVDVQYSSWDCTLELVECPEEDQRALRMGARFVKGLSEEDWARLERAREREPFENLRDCLGRSRLGEGAAARLAEAGAFESFELGRREALWLSKGLVRTPDLPMELREHVDEQRPAFESLDQFDVVRWDYRTTGHSGVGHP
ncbi:MAG: error-prone DNA polymerase, partial [Bradymonadaceae bacterium]